MPAEKFWNSDRVEGDEPNLTISWGHPVPGEMVTPLFTSSGMPLLFDGGDVAGLDRMIATLRRVRRAMEPHRAPCVDGDVCGEPAHCPPPETPEG